MSEETVHKVQVHLDAENPPVRQAHLLCTGEVVTFGTPGWQGEHYGFPPGTAEDNPGTLDFLVASVGGCLIGTLGGALKARGIDGSGGRLAADATGEVVVDPDGVLRLRRIDIVYHLRADEFPARCGGARPRPPRRPLPQRPVGGRGHRHQHRARADRAPRRSRRRPEGQAAAGAWAAARKTPPRRAMPSSISAGPTPL